MYRTIRQFQVVREDFLSSNGIFIHFQCVNETFLQLLVWQHYLPSISSLVMALSVNFWSGSSTSGASTGTYVTFHASTGPSVNF